MDYTQQDIDINVFLYQGKMIHSLISAANHDVSGSWKRAVKCLDEAVEYHQKSKIIQTDCGKDLSEYINKNTGVVLCDLEEETGIGFWAIGESARGCNVFVVRGGQLPPPYGEFSKLEFVTQEFTQEQTS